MDNYVQITHGDGEHRLIIAKVNNELASDLSNPYRYSDFATELMLSYDGEIISTLPIEKEALIGKPDELAKEIFVDLSNATIVYVDLSYPTLALKIRPDKLLPFPLADTMGAVPVRLDDLVENQSPLNILDIQTLDSGVESARDTFVVESGVMIKFEGNIISYQSVIVSEDQDNGFMEEPE